VAREAFEHGEPFEARRALEQGLADSPSDFGLRLAYAAVLLQDGDLAAGLEQLQALRKTCPWSPVVEAYTGGALLALGRITEAKDILDDAGARAPGDFYVLLKRGELMCRLGIYESAVQLLESAVRTPVDDHLAREAARRLLRFAREKARTGFVRRLSGATHIGFPLNLSRLHLPWHGTSRSKEAWGL
jgi:predicted Zn-dependent protease